MPVGPTSPTTPAPERVVEVHGGNLPSSDAALDGHPAGDDVGEQRVPRRVEAHAAEVPQARVVHRGAAHLARGPIEVGDHHAPPQLAELTDPRVQMRQRGLPAPRRGGSEQVLGGRALGAHQRDMNRRTRSRSSSVCTWPRSSSTRSAASSSGSAAPLPAYSGARRSSGAGTSSTSPGARA